MKASEIASRLRLSRTRSPRRKAPRGAASAAWLPSPASRARSSKAVPSTIAAGPHVSRGSGADRARACHMPGAGSSTRKSPASSVAVRASSAVPRSGAPVRRAGRHSEPTAKKDTARWAKGCPFESRSRPCRLTGSPGGPPAEGPAKSSPHRNHAAARARSALMTFPPVRSTGAVYETGQPTAEVLHSCERLRVAVAATDVVTIRANDACRADLDIAAIDGIGSDRAGHPDRVAIRVVRTTSCFPWCPVALAVAASHRCFEVRATAVARAVGRAAGAVTVDDRPPVDECGSRARAEHGNPKAQCQRTENLQGPPSFPCGIFVCCM